MSLKKPNTRLRSLFTATLACLIAAFGSAGFAEVTTETDVTDINITCPDAEVLGSKMISGICWDCILPMGLLGKIIVMGDGLTPDDKTDDIGCRCADDSTRIGYRFGMTFSAWLPSYVVETVKAPMCSPTLGGVVIGGGDVKTVEGNEIFDIGGQRPAPPAGITQYTRSQEHMLEFPIMTVLRFIDKFECLHGGLPTIDLAKVPTEFMPTWNDDELGSLVNGAVCVIASLPGMPLTCAAEGMSLTSGLGPFKDMYWCNGFSGDMNCPMTGTIVDPDDPVSEHSTLASRYLLMQHIMGQMGKAFGDDALCGEEGYSFFTPKDGYKHSLIFPVNQSSSGSTASALVGKPTTPSGGPSGECCQYFGEHAFTWALGRTIPGVGEDYVSILYRYHQCCITLL
jgi:conjugal transfer pilus assembly protein TraU